MKDNSTKSIGKAIIAYNAGPGIADNNGIPKEEM